MLQALSQRPERQGLGASNGLLASGTVRERASYFQHLSQPAAIGFLFRLNSHKVGSFSALNLQTMSPDFLKPIRTEADYRTALARVEAIFQAQPGDPELDELDILTTLIEAYEAQHYAVPDSEEHLNGLLSWLQTWYASMCDDEWEFHEGIKILSVSNPGWSVEINLEGTIAEDLSMSHDLIKSQTTIGMAFLLKVRCLSVSATLQSWHLY